MVQYSCSPILLTTEMDVSVVSNHRREIYSSHKSSVSAGIDEAIRQAAMLWACDDGVVMVERADDVPTLARLSLYDSIVEHVTERGYGRRAYSVVRWLDSALSVLEVGYRTELTRNLQLRHPAVDEQLFIKFRLDTWAEMSRKVLGRDGAAVVVSCLEELTGQQASITNWG